MGVRAEEEVEHLGGLSSFGLSGTDCTYKNVGKKIFEVKTECVVFVILGDTR